MNKYKGLLVVLVAVLVVLACTVPFKDRVQAEDKVTSYDMIDNEGNVYAVTSDKELAGTAYDYDTSDSKEINLFYMYEVEHGTYWLDPSADDENVIWVDDESLEEWGISKRDLHHGNKFIGLFDSTGWELEGMKEIE